MQERFQLGEVVRLHTRIGEIRAGLWVVTEIDWLISLNRLGENEDGEMCTVFPQVRITRDEAEQLVSLHLNIYANLPLHEDATEGDL